MAETLGGLIDKLITTNTKLWFVQDRVHEASLRHNPLDAETVRKLDVLNRQRNSLMTEIDQLHAADIAAGKGTVEERVKV